ncbi:nuclear transport factor 2 family protein [Portibacter marinus]|uniref:nuclear transport factor 2 family protein n=1 Tax=Portibacter marinus TaxID=2898660 RepID=UPI001F46506D|nr:nuclear transport factor 2 family protein [Portibacter marinus]
MRTFLMVFFVVLGQWLFGQNQVLSDQEQEVYNVIVKLFDGMRAGDSTMVHEVFSDDVRMYTCFKDKNGEIQIQQGDLNAFLNAVGSPHEEMWDERIWNTKVDVEMGVAQIWTEYAFYIGETFSHCGIDAFQLIKEEDWKIIHLMDTRIKDNCDKTK